ncbi:hypothetical protein [Pontibacter harenae]|uniref:hypothetical protein n=1 Tax=Pontibacter harenae TaxID=2894083 RepID=UPI001E63987C|nr:hypothetical protein [Pontibacter harenae]MCC9168010.1 hypothetical protein [Pontibacter harenae]
MDELILDRGSTIESNLLQVSAPAKVLQSPPPPVGIKGLFAITLLMISKVFRVSSSFSS